MPAVGAGHRLEGIEFSPQADGSCNLQRQDAQCTNPTDLEKLLTRSIQVRDRPVGEAQGISTRVAGPAGYRLSKQQSFG